MSSGERPIGAAKGKQSDAEALCHPPPPPRSAHKSVLESANPRTDSECASGCTWSTARGNSPSLGRPTPGVV